MDKKIFKFKCYNLNELVDGEILKSEYCDKTCLNYLRVKCICGEEHYLVTVRGGEHE